jgi:hypothetical protein
MDEYDQHQAIEDKSAAVANAYRNLAKPGRVEVDWVAEKLDDQMSRRNERARFSHAMAVELLGKIGMLVVHSEETRRAVTRRQGDRVTG